MLDIPAHPVGLSRDLFNKHLDGLLETGTLNPDILPHMNEFQQRVINEVKKSIKRFKAKL